MSEEAPAHFDVVKTTRGWLLRRRLPNGIDMTFAYYPTRDAALTTGKLLAGWRGLVTVNGKAI
jgi:hypothetical protein